MLTALMSMQNHEHHGAVQIQGRKRQKREKPETHLQRLARHVQSDKVSNEAVVLHCKHRCLGIRLVPHLIATVLWVLFSMLLKLLCILQTDVM